MTSSDFDDETLMAFADGEADALTTARIEAALAADPALGARITMFRQTRQAVGDAFKPLIDQPVPADMMLSVQAMVERDAEARAQQAGEPKVVSLAQAARKRKAPVMPPWFAPLAAAVVLMIGAAGGYIVGVTMPGGTQMEFASISDPAIIQALSETPSGRQIDLRKSGRTLEPVLSFQLEDGTLCREFKLREANAKGVVSIACLEEDRWQTHLMMAATRTEEGYIPAGSAETIDAYLASIHASSPLDGSAEEEALRSIRH